MSTDATASPGSRFELGGTVFDGRFRLEARIAEGGFAVVYRAWQIALEREVALKVLKAPRHQDELGRVEFRERFAAEAKTIARLGHPHIVKVYDFAMATLPSGELAPWMALEWLEGQTLGALLDERRQARAPRRDPRDAVLFLKGVLEALAHAHAHGVVHRDVKPANIMVAELPDGPSLRLLDFGIAKIMLDDRAPNTGSTRTESVPAFSPAYASPEQVTFSRTGPWTDVHALGLILSELMTDQAPFTDADPDAHLFERVMAQQRPTPASKGTDVGVFEPILAKALALSPRDRFRNSGELLQALEQAQAARSATLHDSQLPMVIDDPAHDARAHRAWPRRLGVAGAVVGLVAALLLVMTESRGSTVASEPAMPSPGLASAKVVAPQALVFPSPGPALQASTRVESVSADDLHAKPQRAPGPRRVRAKLPPSATAAPTPALGDGRDLFADPR